MSNLPMHGLSRQIYQWLCSFCLSLLTKNLLILSFGSSASHTHSMILILVLVHFDFPCNLPNQWSNLAFSLSVCECCLLSQSVSNIHGSCLFVIMTVTFDLHAVPNIVQICPYLDYFPFVCLSFLYNLSRYNDQSVQWSEIPSLVPSFSPVSLEDLCNFSGQRLYDKSSINVMTFSTLFIVT